MSPLLSISYPYLVKQEALQQWPLTDADIPLNCPEAEKQRVFVCENRPKILHYQVHTRPLDIQLWTHPLYHRI